MLLPDELLSDELLPPVDETLPGKYSFTTLYIILFFHADEVPTADHLFLMVSAESLYISTDCGL